MKMPHIAGAQATQQVAYTASCPFPCPVLHTCEDMPATKVSNHNLKVITGTLHVTLISSGAGANVKINIIIHIAII